MSKTSDDSGGSAAPSLIERLSGFFTREIWRREWAGTPTFATFGFYVLRLFTIAGRGFVVHRSGFRAAALTYYTVLSMVPFLAFAFAVAKGFGAYDMLIEDTVRPFVESTFGPERGSATEAEGAAPNGSDADADATAVVEVPPVVVNEDGGGQTVALREAIDQVLAFVEGTDVSRLGTFGLALVLFVVVRLLSHVEGALNEIWGVRRARSIPRKLADYTAMVVVAPILALSLGSVGAVRSLGQPDATGEPSWLQENLSGAAEIALRFLPLGSMWLAFVLLFLVLPNTRVRPRSAMVGGLFSAAGWVLAQKLYVGSQVGVASYNELYAGFAAIPLFLIWTWASWIVVILGAQFAYADQNHHAFARRRLAGEATPAETEAVGLRALARITERFLVGATPWTTEELVGELMTPEERLRGALGRLADAGVVARTEAGDGEGWVCGRDPSSVTLLDARRALRGTDVTLTEIDEDSGELDRRLRGALGGLDAATAELDQNSSLSAVVRGRGEPRLAGEAAGEDRREGRA